MIQRILQDTIENQLFNGKAIIILGCRQIGKTTLLKQMFANRDDVMWLNGDDVDTAALLSGMTSVRFREIIGKKKILVIDEAQRVPDIGLRMKLVTDNMPEVQLVASGSSSFELANRLNEPLTGRKREYLMYPLSYAEMVNHHGLVDERRLVPHRMVYGYYPEVVNSNGEERDVLKDLTDSYLYKDIFMLGIIKKNDKLVKLLQALAFQVGSQVSYSELASLVGIDSKTVETYIDLMEKSYIVFRLPSFSRNMRNELKHSRKVYFYDNGVRNAVISAFSPLENRNDVGALWENFLVAERMKRNQYKKHWCNCYFWRTKEQNEIDYIEEYDGTIYGYEFKYNPRKAARVPKGFAKAYPDAQFKEITADNIDDFLLG